MFVQEKVERKSMMNGSFSPSEARQIVNSLVKQYRNFYNLQFMKSWEGNHNFDTHEFDQKINRLQSLQNELNSMIREASDTGTQVDVEGLLQLNLR